MLLLRQNIHLLVHMLLIGRVIWLTRHFYFLINEGDVEELHRVTILVHVIIHCLLEHGGEITIHSAWTAFLASLAALTNHTGGANNCGGGVVVFIPSWGCVVVGVVITAA